MGASLVIDASVVAKLYLRDEKWLDKADEVFRQFGNGELELLAPRLISYEVPAAICKASSRQRLESAKALEAIRRFWSLRLPVFEETASLLEEAFRLAHIYGCALYDAIYLALAKDLDWPFVTADEKLHRDLRYKVPYLILLPSFS